MKFLRERGIALIGFAETPIERNSGKSALELGAQALMELLGRRGLARCEIDGLALSLALSEAGDPFWSNLVAETFGLSPAWLQVTDLGGASAIGNVARAAAAIHAGQCEVVVCLHADAPCAQMPVRPAGYRGEFLEAVGYSGPPAVFGLLSSAYRDRHGMPEAALAKLAVAQRNAALLNANACAQLRKPLTTAEYLQSRMVADPLRMLDCVLRCDGANAVLVTSTAKARQLGLQRLVHPIAYRELTNFDPLGAVEDITVSGFSRVGPQALSDASMKAADVRMFQPYDDFLIAVLLQLEQIGFCSPGQSGAFLLERDLSHRGPLPINTGGGQISAGQPGLASGGVNLVEAVRQLLGDGDGRQVPDPTNAMVTGIGAMQYARNWGTSNVMILEAG